jgi:hypothetical protein
MVKDFAPHTVKLFHFGDEQSRLFISCIVLENRENKMKFTTAVVSVTVMATSGCAFSPASSFGAAKTGSSSASSNTGLCAVIRDKKDKSQELRFGWDGTTALGGAVEQAKPARMLDDIRAAAETIPDECEVFNANVEMDADSLKFEDVMDLIDKHYETGLIEFKNGDIVNKQGQNEGSAKLLSYAALSQLDEQTTLKLWGQYYREVLKDPNGDSHQNIRNFMKTGWKGEFFGWDGGGCIDFWFAAYFSDDIEDEDYYR